MDRFMAMLGSCSRLRQFRSYGRRPRRRLVKRRAGYLMLEHLRQRIIQTLAGVRAVTLSTYGPAELQASRLPCQVVEIDLYVLVPRSSDHLFNIESKPDVVVVNENWNLQGTACLVTPDECPPEIELTRRPEAAWSEIIKIHPGRLTILRPSHGSPLETIDV
jgi:hypothetical protein